MSIWNKILLGLVGVASLALFYLAARTLKTHQYWYNLAQQYQAKIDQVQSDTYKLREGVAPDGTSAPPGIRQVRRELDQLLIDRGRVWHNCVAKLTNVDKAKGTVEARVTADASNPDSLANKGNCVVYAFEEANAQDGGRYLGEFRVSVGPDKQPLLQSAMMMPPREIERLTAAKQPWVLYEQMPHDNHRLFADLTDKQKEAILPRDVATEYLNDGKPAAKNEPADHTVNGKYVRALRDYQTLFHADRINWTQMLDLFEATTRDKALIDSALADARRQEQADAKHVVEAKEKLAKFAHQRDIVKAYHEKLQSQLEAVTAEVDQLLKANQAAADQLARSQWEAVRRIDQRVHDMVQSNAEGR